MANPLLQLQRFGSLKKAGNAFEKLTPGHKLKIQDIRVEESFDNLKNKLSQSVREKLPEFLEERKNTLVAGITERTRQLAPQVARFGQALQQFPDTTLELPEQRIGRVTLPTDYARKATQLASSLPGETIRGYGRTLERLSTQRGQQELAESARRIAREGVSLNTINEPATQALLDVTDFVPGIGLIGFGGIVKKGGGELLEKATREAAEKVVRQAEEKSAQELFEATGKRYAFNINKPRLGLEGEAARKLDEVVEQIRPVLETTKGKPLTNKEIIREGRKASLLTDVLSRDEAAEFSARLQASRNLLKTEAEASGVTPQFIEQLKIVSSEAADKARKLRAFAVDAENVSLKERVLQELVDLGNDTSGLVEAASKVDWKNADQVTDFYRKFKPANLAEKLDEYRYVNMLSSPNTHLVNTFSNFIQSALVTPVEKTLAGQIDWVKKALTGRERQYYADQGVKYAVGYWKALPKAWDSFKSTLKSGNLTKFDTNFIPTGTGKVQKIYTTPLRALEASDQFFKSLIVGGEEASLKRVGITGEKAAKLAEESAEYRLFRQSFDPDGKLGQNIVLKTFDKWSSVLSSIRRAPGGKWIEPFIRVPSNILKQGLEFSPFGITTVPGAREPITQLAKTAIGSGVFLSAYALAKSGAVTWDAPLNPSDKNEFYAAGLQPYSVKINGKWVSYSKLGPLSYPIAMAAAMKWAEDNGATNSSLAIAGQGLAGTLQFFADQSYVENLGDILDFVRNPNLAKYKGEQIGANLASQLVPYRAMLGWVARLVDPVYRKSESVFDNLKTQIPFLSKTVPPYETPFGELSSRDLVGLNAASPLQIRKTNPEIQKNYETHQDIKVINRALEKGELPTRGRAGENQQLVNLIAAEYVKSQLEKSTDKEELFKTAEKLKLQGILNEEVVEKVAVLNKLDKKDLTRKDRELLLYDGKWRALLILKRLEDFTDNKNKMKKLRTYKKLGIIDEQIAKYMLEVEKNLQGQEEKESAEEELELESLRESRKTSLFFGKLKPATGAGGKSFYIPAFG